MESYCKVLLYCSSLKRRWLGLASAMKRTSLISVSQRSRMGFLNWNHPLSAWRAPSPKSYMAGAAICLHSALPTESWYPKWKTEELTWCFLVSKPTGNCLVLWVFYCDLFGIAKGAFPSPFFKLCFVGLVQNTDKSKRLALTVTFAQATPNFYALILLNKSRCSLESLGPFWGI